MSRPFEALLIAALTATACHKEEPPPRLTKEQLEKEIAELERRHAAREAAKRAATSVGSGTPGGEAMAYPPGSAAAPSETTHPAAAAAAPNGSGPWVVDNAVGLGPGAPATATSLGVVVNDREGSLFFLRLGSLAQGNAPGRTDLPSLPEGSGPYSLGRGPGVFGGAAYWISHGSLVRRTLSPRAVGPLEILAKDAADGTRVAVPIPAPGRTLAKIPATAAYIVRPEKEDAPLVAKLWVEGAEALPLTAEGNSTHSVSLVHTEDGVFVLSVQARMAMTPVHARKIRFASGKPLPADDLVAWVGGGIQPLTEMTLLPNGADGLFGFIPHERSIKEFGVAELALGMNPTMDTKTTWLVYPNGIDPAPVAAAHLCGEPILFYAAPESAAPDSPQEIVLRSLSDESGKRFQRVAAGHQFYFTSIAEVSGGALAVWVGEDGTHAATVRCQRSVLGGR